MLPRSWMRKSYIVTKITFNMWFSTSKRTLCCNTDVTKTLTDQQVFFQPPVTVAAVLAYTETVTERGDVASRHTQLESSAAAILWYLARRSALSVYNLNTNSNKFGCQSPWQHQNLQCDTLIAKQYNIFTVKSKIRKSFIAEGKQLGHALKMNRTKGGSICIRLFAGSIDQWSSSLFSLQNKLI